MGEAVGFVADLLEESEAWVVSSEFEGLRYALDVDEFFFFGDGDDHWGFGVELVKGVHGGVELADAAVY